MAAWIYFVFIAYVIWTITSIIDKIVISKGHIKSPLVFIILNGLMNILLIFIVPFSSLSKLSYFEIGLAITYGIALNIGVTLYYKAVQYEEISKIIILNQIVPVFVLVLSYIFLGEILTSKQLIGFLFLIGAGILVSYRKSKESFHVNKAVYLIFLSSFAVAIAHVASKQVYSSTDFWSAFIWLRLASFSSLLLLLVPKIRNDFTRTFSRMNKKIKSLLGFKMLIDFSAFIFFGFAVLNGKISLVNSLGNSLHPLFVFIGALLISLYMPSLFKEKIDKASMLTKLASIILIIAGVVFVNS